MPLTTLTGPLGRKRAAHLLRRACTGASISEIDEFATLTATEAFARLMDDEVELPTPLAPIDTETGTEWIETGITDQNGDNLLTILNGWILGQVLGTDVADELKLSYSFRERIIFFMHTLFTTKQSKVRDTRFIYYQIALFRHFAFDRNDREVPTPNPDPESEEILPPTIYPINFKHLTKKICVENAMLHFLDGRQNVKGNPNENFARELLELYSIGRGLEGQTPESDAEGDYIYFTEEDVQAAARVLSGFNTDDTFTNIDEETELPRGVIRGGNIATQHDNDTKTFSFRFNNATVSPDPELLLGTSPTEESVIDEISQLIDLIYEQDETPQHICRRLYRFFVYHDVTPEVESGMIQDMAQVLIDNDYKLAPVLEALFTSVEFYEGVAGVTDDFFGGLIKSPYDITLGYLKNFGISIPSAQTQTVAFDDFTVEILGELSAQGMDFYDPFEVAGYPAYHQFPIYNRSWITTNYLTNRYDFIRQRISSGIVTEIGGINPYDFVRANVEDSVARDARALVIRLVEEFLPMSSDISFEESETSELTQARMNYFLNTFLGTMDADPEAAWTSNWDAADDPEKAASQLTDLFNALLQSPEYQLM